MRVGASEPEHWQRWRSEPHPLKLEGRETLADLSARVAGALDELFAGLVEGGVAVEVAGVRRLLQTNQGAHLEGLALDG